MFPVDHSQDDEKKRPVLQDVADLVGVTKMTVSRYLRNPEQVSEALRGKIAVALDELGYIPNRAPDILSNATSRAIGVLPSLTNRSFGSTARYRKRHRRLRLSNHAGALRL